ncbi:MAG: hypothetical protein JO352_19885 [Chloroflexi bacterium]|nr:hypothetical protein [Chloroflexota bacterium]
MDLLAVRTGIVATTQTPDGYIGVGELLLVSALLRLQHVDHLCLPLDLKLVTAGLSDEGWREVSPNVFEGC